MKQTKQVEPPEVELPEEEIFGYGTGKPWGNIKLWCTDYDVFKAIKDLWQKERIEALQKEQE